MLEEEKTVGPKGQVVIPRALRKVLKIHPGSKVVFKLEGNKVTLSKPELNTVAVLQRIAAGGPSVEQISPHQYEEEIASRTR